MFARTAVTPAEAVEIAARYWIAPELSREEKIERDWRFAAMLDAKADASRAAGDHRAAKYFADRALAAANRAINH